MPQSQIGVNGQEDNLLKHFNNYQDKKYHPHQDWISQNANMPLTLLSADEKVTELNQIIEAMSNETNDLKGQIDGQ